MAPASDRATRRRRRAPRPTSPRSPCSPRSSPHSACRAPSTSAAPRCRSPSRRSASCSPARSSAPARASSRCCCFLALVAAGLPLLSGGRGGLAVFVGPSVGYLVGWLLGVARHRLVHRSAAPPLPRARPRSARPRSAASSPSTSSACRCSRRSPATPLDVAFARLARLPARATSLKVVVTVLVAKGVHRAWPGLIAPRPWPWRSQRGGRPAAHERLAARLVERASRLAFGGERRALRRARAGRRRRPARRRAMGLIGCPAGTAPVAPRHDRARRARPRSPGARRRRRRPTPTGIAAELPTGTELALLTSGSSGRGGHADARRRPHERLVARLGRAARRARRASAPAIASR